MMGRDKIWMRERTRYEGGKETNKRGKEEERGRQTRRGKNENHTRKEKRT
jgi:hypothetical protein